MTDKPRKDLAETDKDSLPADSTSPISDETERAILDGIVAGATEREVRDMMGISWRAWYRHFGGPLVVGNDTRARARARQRLLAAREEAARSMVEEAREISDKDPDPQRAKNRIHVRLWTASRQHRQQWGEQLDVNLTHYIDVGGALAASRNRVITGRMRSMRDQHDDEDAQVIEGVCESEGRSTD